MFFSFIHYVWTNFVKGTPMQTNFSWNYFYKLMWCAVIKCQNSKRDLLDWVIGTTQLPHQFVHLTFREMFVCIAVVIVKCLCVYYRDTKHASIPSVGNFKPLDRTWRSPKDSTALVMLVVVTDRSKLRYLDTYSYFADFSATVLAIPTATEQDSGALVMSYLTSSASALKLNDTLISILSCHMFRNVAAS